MIVRQTDIEIGSIERLAGYSGTSFITRGTKEGHLLTSTLRFQMTKAREGPKHVHSFPVNRTCPEFLPTISSLISWANDVDNLSSLLKTWTSSIQHCATPVLPSCQQECASKQPVPRLQSAILHDLPLQMLL